MSIFVYLSELCRTDKGHIFGAMWVWSNHRRGGKTVEQLFLPGNCVFFARFRRSLVKVWRKKISVSSPTFWGKRILLPSPGSTEWRSFRSVSVQVNRLLVKQNFGDDILFYYSLNVSFFGDLPKWNGDSNRWPSVRRRLNGQSRQTPPWTFPNTRSLFTNL